MSIDEVCKYVEDYVNNQEMCDKIIDLLRAGQAMRRSFPAIDDATGAPLATDIHRFARRLAGQAWDEALKEAEERL